MKQIGGLFEQVATRPNLVQALWRASRGKRDRPEVSDFVAQAPERLHQIGRQLAAGHYRFAAYRSFEVRDTKRRCIHAPSFQDRVVHHAIMAVTGPVLERGALVHSYACRRGRGQHAALQQARSWLRRTDWYGKMDVRRFYDSIHHDTLRALLLRRFRECHLLSLFDALLDSYQTAPGRGLPIGALTSQYLGNFYLDRFDHQLKAKAICPRYLRYMDDALVLGSRAQIDRVREVASPALAELGLALKNGGEWNRAERGIPFLGFVLYPDRIRVNFQGRRRFRRKLRGLKRAWSDERLDDIQLQARATSLVAHVRRGDDLAWRQTVLDLHDFGAETGAPERDTPQRPARDPRRLLEQPSQELPLGLSQQEPPWQQEPQPGIPRGLVPRHEDGGRKAPSTDGACSCSIDENPMDKPPRKPPPGPDIQSTNGPKNGSGGAALDRRMPDDV